VYAVNQGVIMGEGVRPTFLTNDAHARDIDNVGKRIKEGEDGSIARLLR
jgi:hypothetical protein